MLLSKFVKNVKIKIRHFVQQNEHKNKKKQKETGKILKNKTFFRNPDNGKNIQKRYEKWKKQEKQS